MTFRSLQCLGRRVTCRLRCKLVERWSGLPLESVQCRESIKCYDWHHPRLLFATKIVSVEFSKFGVKIRRLAFSLF